MRRIWIMIGVTLIVAAIFFITQNTTKETLSIDKLSESQKQTIYFVTKGAMFASAQDLEESQNPKVVFEKIFRDIDRYYKLSVGSAKLIYLEFVKGSKQLSDDTEFRLFVELSEKASWSIADVEKIVKVESVMIGQKPEEYTKTITRLINKLKKAKNASDRYAIINQLVEFGSDATDPMVAALNDKDPFNRGFLVYGLGKIGDRKATPALIERLSDKGIFDYGIMPPYYVAAGAADALGDMGDIRAIKPIKQELSVAKKYNPQMSDSDYDVEKVVANEEFIKALKNALAKLEQ